MKNNTSPEVNKDDAIAALNARYTTARNTANNLLAEGMDLKAQLDLQNQHINKLMAENTALREENEKLKLNDPAPPSSNE